MTAKLDTEKIYTIEEFLNLPDDGRQYELMKGHITGMVPPLGSEHFIISGRLHGYLFAYVEANDLGEVGHEGGFTLGYKDTVYMPDVAFVARGRLKMSSASA